MTSRTHLASPLLLSWSITGYATYVLRYVAKGAATPRVTSFCRVIGRVHHTPFQEPRSLRITISCTRKRAPGRGEEGSGRGGGDLILPRVADDVSRLGDSGTRDEWLAWAYLRVLRDKDGNKEGTGHRAQSSSPPSLPPPPTPLRMKSSGGNKKFFQKEEIFIYFFFLISIFWSNVLWHFRDSYSYLDAHVCVTVLNI